MVVIFQADAPRPILLIFGTIGLDRHRTGRHMWNKTVVMFPFGVCNCGETCVGACGTFQSRHEDFLIFIWSRLRVFSGASVNLMAARTSFQSAIRRPSTDPWNDIYVEGKLGTLGVHPGTLRCRERSGRLACSCPQDPSQPLHSRRFLVLQVCTALFQCDLPT